MGEIDAILYTADEADGEDSKHYRISDEELAWLAARVEALGRVVETICLERIEMLERSAAA